MWDPSGLVAGEAFREYVSALRETSNYASGGEKTRSDTMRDTLSGSYGGIE